MGLQMENVTSYQFMRSHKGGRIHIHAFWFDIYTGDIHIFSRKENTFVVVNDETLPKLESELHEIIAQTHITDSRLPGYQGSPKLDTEVPNLKSLIIEARRNFSTNPCQHGCEHTIIRRSNNTLRNTNYQPFRTKFFLYRD